MEPVSQPEKTQQLETIPQSNEQPYEQIPILYVWFGKTVPEDYLISLSELNYPVLFLKNPKIERKFNRELFDVEKADYYRLWHLYENGGIYSDFDNTIDYPCLMRLLKPYKNKDKLVFMTDGRHTRQKTQQITVNLIYAPYPKMPILKTMLDAIDQTKLRVWEFAGTKFVGQFQQPIEMNMSSCVQHSYDWSWYQASNEVLGLNAEAHRHFAKKLIKKEEIMHEKEGLESEVVRLASRVKYLEADLRQAGHQMAAYKSEVEEAHQRLVEFSPDSLYLIEKFDEKVRSLQPSPIDPQASYFVDIDVDSTPTNQQQDESQQNLQQYPTTLQQQYPSATIDLPCGLAQTQRAQLWKRIDQLQDINEKYQVENFTYKWEAYGMGAFLVIIVVAVLVVMGRRKVEKSRFKKLSTRDNSSRVI